MKKQTEFMGPPPTRGLAPIAVATKSKRGGWVWKSLSLTADEKKTRKEWEEKLKEADKKGKWRFKFKPKKGKAK